MQTEKAKSSHFDRTRGLKNQIFPTLAITSMVLKDDYKMFFGDDTSTYVSIFCDLADAMVKMADPSSQEISRLHTGKEGSRMEHSLSNSRI